VRRILKMIVSSFADYDVELGSFVHDVEGEMFCESSNPKIPYFNAPIYLENKVYIHDTDMSK
jgi:H/ACA ribonucleoprotein complex subunit 1